MRLESLKNGKFEKNVLSPSAMRMLDGGKTYPTGKYAEDSIRYHCSGENGDLYDRTVTDFEGTTVKESPTPFPGTDDSYYVD